MFLYQGPVTALRKQSPQTRVLSQAIWATQSRKRVLENAVWALWLPAFGWGLLTVMVRWANLSIRHLIYHCKALLPCLIYSRLGCSWWKADNSVHTPFRLSPQKNIPLGGLDYYFLCHINNQICRKIRRRVAKCHQSLKEFSVFWSFLMGINGSSKNQMAWEKHFKELISCHLFTYLGPGMNLCLCFVHAGCEDGCVQTRLWFLRSPDWIIG